MMTEHSVNPEEVQVRQEVLVAIHRVMEKYVGDSYVSEVWGELQERLELGFVKNVGDIQAQIAVSILEIRNNHKEEE